MIRKKFRFLYPPLGSLSFPSFNLLLLKIGQRLDPAIFHVVIRLLGWRAATGLALDLATILISFLAYFLLFKFFQQKYSLLKRTKNVPTILFLRLDGLPFRVLHLNVIDCKNYSTLNQNNLDYRKIAKKWKIFRKKEKFRKLKKKATQT